MSAERVVQAAIYAALVGDAPLMALVSGVYDGDPPKGTAYPYTILGELTEANEDTHDKAGYQHTLTVHDWSAYDGRLECQNIREARNAVIHRADLSAAGYNLTDIVYEFGEILDDWDDDLKVALRHQVTRYRVYSLAT